MTPLKLQITLPGNPKTASPGRQSGIYPPGEEDVMHATAGSCPSGDCSRSSLVNVRRHRSHGEPASSVGEQACAKDRPSGGPVRINDKTPLKNKSHHHTSPAPGTTSEEQFGRFIGYWDTCASIQPNNFKYKSLSNWSYNIAVGCGHACRFCYVPDASAIKLKPQLGRLGVTDPDVDWGRYVFLRPWDERRFLSSLRKAESTPRHELKPDGNRAVILCSTTDAYQVFPHPDPAERRRLSEHGDVLVRRALELIRDQSTLNVRILTRSPLAERDFELYRSFGNRLVFGMSLPTLQNRLAKIYEPNAPAPTLRLRTLRKAKEAGLHVYVAMAPTYPECDETDLAATLVSVRELDPITVFHEPINIRAENVRRIEDHARSLGVAMQTAVFETPETWTAYALDSLRTVERIAGDLGLSDRLHLWPDQSLGSRRVLKAASDPLSHQKWLDRWWYRISEWPTSD